VYSLRGNRERLIISRHKKAVFGKKDAQKFIYETSQKRFLEMRQLDLKLYPDQPDDAVLMSVGDVDDDLDQSERSIEDMILIF
jgi:hypothetical protein